MLFKAYNRALVDDRKKTFLTAAVAAAGTTLTVQGVNADVGSDSTWADNVYMILGEIGSPTAEILQMNGAASDGTSLTIDQSGAGGCRFAHSIGEPVYRLDFNRVEFNYNTTNTTSGLTVLATQLIQPDEEYTRYNDVTSTEGFGFVRFNNQTTGVFSSYSDGVNYEATGESSSFDPRTLWKLRKRVRVLLDEDRPNSKLTDDAIRDALNDKQRDIAHQRLWSFYEGERSFSTVANQFAYDLPATVQKVYNAQHDTQPLVPMNYDQWKLISWDNNSSVANPYNICVWDRQILLWPRPSTAAQTTTLGAAISSTTATSITVASSSGFNRGDYYRFIIDSEVIYATASTSTTFTGCIRGSEGTTAATHSDGATVTERDIVYTVHEEPTDLFDTQDRTNIPEVDVLVYGAAIDLAPLVEKSDLIDRFERKYTTKLKELEGKYSVKFTSKFGKVRSSDAEMDDSIVFRDSNRFPSSIVGT